MAGHGDGTGGVQRTHRTGHQLQLLKAIVAVLDDGTILVVHAPGHHAGVVAVPEDEIGEVPFQKLHRVHGPGDAGKTIPLVKGFINHQQAHAVAELRQFGSGHIVAVPYGIHAHFLHNPQLTFHGYRQESSPQRSLVMMQAHPLHIHSAAVEQHPVVGGKHHRTEPKSSLGNIQLLALTRNDSLHRVEVRGIQIPQLHIRYAQFLLQHMAVAGPDLERSAHRSHLLAVRGENPGGHLNFLVLGFVAQDAGAQHHLRLLARHHGSQHLGSPDVHPGFVGVDQRHLAVQPGSGIPAAVVAGGVQIHSHHIVLAGLHKRGDIHKEGVVAIIPASCQLPVHIHLRKSHGTVKKQEYFLVRTAFFDHKMFAVPAIPFPWQFAGGTRGSRVEGTTDGPVVGEPDGCPGGIIKGHFGGLFGIALGKFPVFVEVQHFGTVTIHAQTQKHGNQQILERMTHR